MKEQVFAAQSPGADLALVIATNRTACAVNREEVSCPPLSSSHVEGTAVDPVVPYLFSWGKKTWIGGA
jgi:hypothetical protein